METSSLPAPISRIAAGNHHSCALLKNGSVACWGRNSFGQLGLGSSDSDKHALPTLVSGDVAYRNVVDVAVGGMHSCALLASNEVACWGRNDSRQLGRPGEDQLEPTLVDSGLIQGHSVGIAVAGSTSCALLDEGTIACWGEGSSGMLGDGNAHTPASASPTLVDSPALMGGAERVVGGSSHFCAQLKSGALVCWGANTSGLLGGGSLDESEFGPVAVIEPLATVGSQWAALSGSHSCALGRNGAVYCWGANHRGNLGNGETSVSVPTPSPAATSELWDHAIGLGAFSDGSCAIGDNGLTACWGSNDRGQIGNGQSSGIVEYPEVIMLNW